jgi:hypothetical protein
MRLTIWISLEGRNVDDEPLMNEAINEEDSHSVKVSISAYEMSALYTPVTCNRLGFRKKDEEELILETMQWIRGAQSTTLLLHDE